VGNVGCWGDPFEDAARRAEAKGICPVNELEGFYTDHWDRDSLCSGFKCRECVATPEDFGWPDWGEPPYDEPDVARPPFDDFDLEIDF
jgi:hypothetical protein